MTHAQEIVYIDTMVFAFRLLPNPNYKSVIVNQSTNFFDDIDSGEFRGITSTFTRIEYTAIVKKVISSIKKRELNSVEEGTALKDFHEFIKGLNIELTDADTLVYDDHKPKIFDATAQTLTSTSPYLDKGAVERKQWKNIGAADALQISFAIRSKAQRFATFDRGFKGLNNPSITPLIIPEQYGASV